MGLSKMEKPINFKISIIFFERLLRIEYLKIIVSLNDKQKNYEKKIN